VVPVETIKILVIEDNPMDVRLLRIALEKVHDWPSAITVAADGDEAINYLLDAESSKPDLVILDLNLPKRDGLEVLQLIRITDYLYGLPVVMLSSSPEDVVKAKIANANMEAELYLTKPASVSEFLAIGAMLRDFYTGRAVASTAG
jgi:two-component system, chemotaxis family, response regulator Rcp1